ncbi:hypothetical protein EsH8_VI_000022 [Colletotrichum jinshuiense]
MQFSFTAAALATLVGYSAAHTQTIDVWINDKAVGDGRSLGGSGSIKYIRSPPSNSPVKDLTSSAIACNVNGGTAATGFAPAAAGDSFQIEWYHDAQGDDIIDGSHKGPIITYIAPYTSGDGTGAIWTKIGEEGYKNGKWAVDNLKTNGGKSGNVTIPASLKAGKYLIRQEVIAHHESDATYDVNPARGAQFYPACLQFEITGTGSDVPPQNFDFNTGYTYADPGIHYNLYSADATTYQIPGPELWTGGSSGGSSPAPSSAAPVASSSAAAQPTTAAPVVTSSAAAQPTTLATSVASAAPVVSSTSAAAPVATPTKAPAAGCKKRRSRKARRSAH